MTPTDWSPEAVAAAMGVPAGNVRRQYAANARQLRQCAAEAERRGGRYRNINHADWLRAAESAEGKAKHGP